MAHMEVGCPRPKMKSDLMTCNGIGCRDRTWPFPLLVRETLEGGSYAGFVHVGGRGYRLRVCEVGGKISVEMEGSLYQLLANEEAMLRLRMSQNDDVGYAPHLPPQCVCEKSSTPSLSSSSRVLICLSNFSFSRPCTRYEGGKEKRLGMRELRGSPC